ncbi:MAG: Gx transporter family protein [Clostridia bacterium]|nr:Gx transporter family protein [Clostridia bacterium]MBR6788126.1 Gx transporter family protein [Clostridia bacterium]
MRRNNRFNVQRTALCGLLTAMMLVLGFIESLIPVAAGVPGIKLGLSNGVLIFALYMLDAPTAFVLMIVKVVLSGLMFGGVSAMMYAMAGGVMSMLTMMLLKKFHFHLVIISMFGAVMHNVGQVLMAMLVLQTPKLMYYMAILMFVGLATGAVTGVAANATIKHIKKLRK